ncbi:DNA-3-methyladenine glycosylase 2 family protein [Limnobacter humi]|uniref:DNA-3-methyladenine glycosylase II n=1 Tax=Limnobacter humi TaxID=1778671 RepID=A0ABT1WI51_9BURK|nr:DNA-3-methyladenine glycosylase 2 family protein [Limnobacter humi]
MNLDPQAPDYWRQACQELARRDAVWAGLIERHADRALRSRGAPYETLLRSLIGQQISVKAADAVWGRVVAALGDVVDSRRLLNLPEERLRAAGLSRSKVSYARALSEFHQAGQLDLALLDGLTDDECIRHLCAIKGIGPWTAHMFLMFGLRRPDVWPADDLGIQKGLSRQFFNGQPITAKEALQFGEKLRPWRTVAAWYLWRSLDPAVVDY